MLKRVRDQFFIDCKPDYTTSIVLAGTGRGGTTWVSEIINYKNEYRYIFEPFHPRRVAICAGKFRDRQYLRPENRDRRFIEAARAILSGRVRSMWSDRYNTRRIAHQRLIKDIRINLLLKWIHSNFPSIPIILLFRHPCAVANSRIKQGWKPYTEDLLAQEELMEDYLNPLRQEIEKAESDFEKHIFLWCIENYVPLRQFKPGEIYLAFYEDFILDPWQEISKLFAFLGRDFDETVLTNVGKLAVSGGKSHLPPSQRDMLNEWKANISEKQAARAVEIMGLFGLDGIYTQDALPDAANAYHVLEAP
jgi:Sulfotransferase domain